MRNLSPIDRLIASADNALRTVHSTWIGRSGRANPAGNIPDTLQDEAERRHAAGLMRVNHAGEIAAQALYAGQALTARDEATRRSMEQSAVEEEDHLAWCEERLQELDARPSMLAPFWYMGSFTIGALAGAAGDKWSLGFVSETERQVESHLDSHLERIAEHDRRSRAIIELMKEDEIRHGQKARDAGAVELPDAVKKAMGLVSKVMTTTAYRF
ncbi:MAG: 2-polyprenyl-3-methyl-6-methoxy-1,4-benzoquinone monooxygenase [Gammaproteobacteria bacterium]|nr:2-polyprenyl-3-methyl-6-methoxy-1,4-benzoquinone monooxygenase [Gammaproteobacteria bacterium]